MKQEGDKQRGTRKWVWLNAPVDATSENMLFLMFWLYWDVISVYMFAWQETGYLIVSDQDFYA